MREGQGKGTTKGVTGREWGVRAIEVTDGGKEMRQAGHEAVEWKGRKEG